MNGSIFRLLFSIVSVSLCLCGSQLFAADPEPPFERGLDLIRNELLVAHSGIRALSLAAHPDDEDGGTLSYLRRTLGVETHICYSTRGEGGQNESGPELGAELAVLRTKEIEAACAILGAKAWYLNLPDFGFSKSADETLKIWGHDKALAAMVRIIRIVRPHIMFTNHDPNGIDHGHHVATGRLAVEAFDAAADSNKFPEQMKEDGTQPWSVSKLYVRRFAPPGATLIFDISTRDALTGLSAPEIAAYALSQHVSQGMRREVRIGEKEPRYFALLKKRLDKDDKESSFMSGLSTAFPDGADLEILKSPRFDDNNILQLEILSALDNARNKNFDSSIAMHFQRAFVESAGIILEARTSDSLTTYGEPIEAMLRIHSDSVAKVSVKKWQLIGETPAWKTTCTDVGENEEIAQGASTELKGTIVAEAGAFPTYPRAQYIYNRIESRNPVSVSITVQTPDHIEIALTCPVPLELTQPLTTTIRPDPVLLFDDPDHDDNFSILARFHMLVTNHCRPNQPLKFFAGIQPANEAPVDKFAALEFHSKEETLSEEFRFLAPVDQLNKGDLLVQTAVWTAEKNFGGSQARIRRVPIKLPPTLNVALVKTYDDTVWNALKALESAGLGLSITQLSADDLRNADLNRYHTIILDIRATQYRPEIRTVKQRLEQFMKDGGNILCLYQKDFDWNASDKDHPARGVGFFRGEGGGGEIAPYPIELSFDRVTNKEAPVRILQPTQTLLLEPNKIWAKDFLGWEQERGVYFPKKWDPHYTALLSSNDEGGPPLDGGLLVADVGQGSFIYTSFVWHRQLRAGVPGAYRFLANFISYPRIKRDSK